MSALGFNALNPVPRRQLVLVGEERLCQGPLHENGAWLPLYEFYFNRDGHGNWYYKRFCKRCYNHQRRPKGGWVRLDRMHFAVVELVTRLGMAEAARRSGVTPTTLRRCFKLDGRYMHRSTAAKVIVALRDAREHDEMRHIDSIRHGAALRGRREKRPELPTDYYRTKGEVRAERERKRLHELHMKQRNLALHRRRRRQNDWAKRRRALRRAARMEGMEPMDLYWQTAEEVCTAKQLRVLELKEKHGFSLRQIALSCDIAIGTVRVHLDAAHRNIHKALKARL